MNNDKLRRSSGFSLVEIMVGLTVGLVTVLVVMQVMEVAESRKRATTSGSDAVVNAALGLYTIERDGKNAGYGMTTVRNSVGCQIKYKYGSSAEANFSLTPVEISDDAAGGPDTIKFMASNKNGVTLPVRIAVDHPRTATNFFVESDLGVHIGDMMIAVPSVMNTATPPTTWCSVFQVTGTGGGAGGGAGGGSGGGSGGNSGDGSGGGSGGGNGAGNGNAQGQNQVLHNSGQSEWNQPGGSVIFPDAGYSAGDYVINLGSFLDHTYLINNNFLVLRDKNWITNTSTDQNLYPNIVQLQAVYGKDTTTPPDNVVDQWNATAPTTAAGWQQVIALRVALVARGQSPEPGIVTLDGTAAASTCNSATPHPAAVCWRPDPNGNGVAINVNVSNTNPNWQRYRYRVVETTIPLRNIIWQQ
ncbi:MAG TPA: PilW family protein [Noviherbaspirillum sp.]|nr:PilW family protein [Noviherbaspirillum sp.]